MSEAEPSLAHFRPDLPQIPWIVIAHTDDRAVREQISTLTPGGVVRYLDATKMTELPGLFAEFGEKLEFPSYYGHNSYALVDCLDSLHGSWHGDRAVAVVVDPADPLVATDFFPVLVSLLCEAAERANISLDADGQPRTQPPFPLHFVFFVEQLDSEALTARLRTIDGVLVQEDDGRLLVWSIFE